MLYGRQIAALLVVISIYCLPQAGMAGNSLICPVFAQSQAPESGEETGSGEQSGSGQESGSGEGSGSEEEEEPEC